MSRGSWRVKTSRVDKAVILYFIKNMLTKAKTSIPLYQRSYAASTTAPHKVRAATDGIFRNLSNSHKQQAR
jgi:hypothetical protein